MSVSVVLIIAMESERVHLDALMPGWKPVEHAVWPASKRGCGVYHIGDRHDFGGGSHRTRDPRTTHNGAELRLCGIPSPRSLSGDVVIGDRLIHQGRMRFAPDGEIIPLSVGFHVPGEETHITEVSTDLVLRKLAQEVSRTLDSAWPEPARLPAQTDRAPIVRTGTVSSGDVWLQSADHHRIKRANRLVV